MDAESLSTDPNIRMIVLFDNEEVRPWSAKVMISTWFKTFTSTDLESPIQFMYQTAYICLPNAPRNLECH